MFLKARVVPTCPVSSCDIRSTSAQMPGWRSVILLAVLFCIQCAASHENRHTYRDIKGLPRHLDRLAGWFARPKKLTEVLPLLPRSRPVQPWSFKNLSTARFYSVAVTDTHAVEATVSHAPLPGVSSQMMQWWFEEGIYGKSSYPNDTTGAVWDNYIRWHPQQHMYQRILAEPTNPGPTQPAVDAAQETSLQQDPQLPQPPLLWEICEYLTSSHPTGYTASNYPGAEATAHEYFVKAEAEVKQLDDQGLWVTVPSKTRLGDTFWNLKHSWVDTPEGLVVNSTQVVGVVDPAWRPLWFARLRNAIVRGLFSQGKDPTVLLSQWVKHCVEEVGNLQHILPELYVNRQESSHNTSIGVSSSSKPGCSSDAHSKGCTHKMVADEL